mmetsp:Transcript_22510/g.42299  ORF Transcript_22510/g.42299 Transcript_22510/m.42299 type:complete len:86 (-) Transcript_22510:166-423(-)
MGSYSSASMHGSPGRFDLSCECIFELSSIEDDSFAFLLPPPADVDSNRILEPLSMLTGGPAIPGKSIEAFMHLAKLSKSQKFPAS